MLLNKRGWLLGFVLLVCSINGVLAQSIVEKAWVLERSGKFQEAFHVFQKAVKECPDTSRAWKGRADMEFRLYKDTDAAIRDYTKAIALKPTALYALESRGMLWYWKKDYPAAIEDFSKVIVLKPDFAIAYNNRAFSKYKLNQYKEAISDFTNALALEPDYAAAYLGRGDAEREMGNYAAAMDDFNKCVGLNPRFKKAYETRVNGDSAFSGMNKVSIIKMQKYGTVYKIPAQIDGIDIDFIFDTGASTVCISDDEATQLKKLGKLNSEDILGDTEGLIANGTLAKGTVIVLRTVRVGNRVLYNIPATITHGTNVPFLMGESVFEKYGKITLDYANGEIIFQ